VNILALDLATVTGWALRENGRLDWGEERFDPRKGESHGMRFLRFNRWLDDVTIRRRSPGGLTVHELRVGALAVERPIPFHKGVAASELLFGLYAMVQEFSERMKVELMVVPPSELKKLATGSGNASKDLVNARAVQRLDEMHVPHGVIGFNASDALWCLWWAEQQIVSESHNREVAR
jgi:hypothetical protein